MKNPPEKAWTTSVLLLGSTFILLLSIPGSVSAQERISFPEAFKSVAVPKGWNVTEGPSFAPKRKTCSPSYETAILARSPDRKMHVFVFELEEETVTANPGACLPIPDEFGDIAINGSKDISMSVSGVINNRARRSSVVVDGKTYDVFVYSHQVQDSRLKDDVSPLIVALWSEGLSDRKRARAKWESVIGSISSLPLDCSAMEMLAGSCERQNWTNVCTIQHRQCAEVAQCVVFPEKVPDGQSSIRSLPLLFLFFLPVLGRGSLPSSEYTQ